MAGDPPVVYIFHGDDEYAIAGALKELESRLGNPANVALNMTRFEAANFGLEGLLSVVSAMPFLAKRRIVHLNKALGKMEQSSTVRDKFLALIEKIPSTTALIITEDQILKGSKPDKPHWLVAWAEENSKTAYIKPFPLPKGSEWTKRVQEMAKTARGQFTPGAAELLYTLVDGDLLLADQEVQKLLAYVNYSRPVEADDVQSLTADVGQGDIFALVDAIGNRDGKNALQMLRRRIEYQDYLSIFGMVVRQFRLLIQTREIMDEGGGENEVIRRLRIKKFLGEKLVPQARNFSMGDLQRIYHKLLDIDEAHKTSQVPGELALEMLVVLLATQQSDRLTSPRR